MTYIPAYDSTDDTAKKLYESKNGKSQKIFDAIGWLALLTTHIPDKSEQMVRYYGYYSNKSRGLRKKAGRDTDVPALMDAGMHRFWLFWENGTKITINKAIKSIMSKEYLTNVKKTMCYIGKIENNNEIFNSSLLNIHLS